MYLETKEAVKRTISMCQILFSMDLEDYIELLEITNLIKFPTREEISKNICERFKDEVIDEDKLSHLIDAELIEELKNRYSEAAIDAGFTAEQGLAMLEYAAILKDLDDDGYG